MANDSNQQNAVTEAQRDRIALIDALRGLAAFAVMLFHFSGHRIFAELQTTLPSWVFGAFRRGDLGVQIFFVISGFVIAYSTRARRADPHFAFDFLRRRALRLAPPYWFAIAAAIGAMWLSRSLFGNDVELPSVARVLAHLFYLQGWLGYEDIYPIFWTLCHEVQFYLIYLLLILLRQRFGCGTELVHIPADGKDRISVALFWILFAVSTIASASGAFKYPGACLDTWYLFALGVLAHQAVYDRFPLAGFAVVSAVVLMINFDAFDNVAFEERFAGVLTSLLLVVAGRCDRLTLIESRKGDSVAGDDFVQPLSDARYRWLSTPQRWAPIDRRSAFRGYVLADGRHRFRVGGGGGCVREDRASFHWPTTRCSFELSVLCFRKSASST